MLKGLRLLTKKNNKAGEKGRASTLSLSRVPKIKIQDKSQMSFCKKLKYK